ncbi:MAG: hypothetical protein K5873_12020 [Treponema sp.]|nr:hypothetical protein [Treponema sp.]
MRDFAIVTGIEGQRIEVVSLISDACVTCNSKDCARQGIHFHAINKKNLPLKVNNVVRIAFPPLLRGFLGLISLLFPIFAGLMGFILSPKLAEYFSMELTEYCRAFFVGIFFFVSAFIVFVISRTDLHFSHPEVIQIM